MNERLDATEIERLLAHSGWLSDLARRLVRDPATADDLVQDTWHAALVHHTLDGKAQRGERVMSERGWLATLLANLARTRARSESARRARERSVAAPESIEGPDRLVERAEAQRNLLARVLELDEPYRSTLLARYAAGESSAEIARRTHVNESTVRTRIARAQEQLRERIERHGGGLSALAPMLHFATPTPSAFAVGGAKTLGTFGAGVGIVGLALKVGVVAVVGLCGWLLWRGFTPSDDRLAWTQPVAEKVAPETLDAPRESPSERVALTAPAPVTPTTEAPAPKPKPAAPASPVDKTRMDITVTRDGVPAMGVRVWIDSATHWPVFLDVNQGAPSTARTLDTNPYGQASFTDLDPKVYNYQLGLGTGIEPARPTRFITTDIFAGYPHEVRLGTASVSGKVYDVSGRERPGVAVQVYSSVRDASHYYLAAQTLVDERGGFRVGDLAAGKYEVIMEPDGRFDGNGERSRISIQVRQGEEKTVDFGSPTGATKWTGRLLNAFNEPFKGGGRLELIEDTEQRWLGAPVGEDGRFELAFTPGTWKVAAFVGCSPPTGFELGRTVLADRDVNRDLIVPGARLRVRMTEPEGGTQEFRQVDVRLEGDMYGIRHGILGADGLRIIDGLSPGRWELRTFPGRLQEGVVPITIGPDQTVVDVLVHWTSG